MMGVRFSLPAQRTSGNTRVPFRISRESESGYRYFYTRTANERKSLLSRIERSQGKERLPALFSRMCLGQDRDYAFKTYSFSTPCGFFFQKNARKVFESWKHASQACPEAISSLLSYVPRPGFEPGIADPKSAVISISPPRRICIVRHKQ